MALPDPARGAADVKVHIGAERLSVAVAGVPVLDGRLFAPVKAEASTGSSRTACSSSRC